MKKYKTIALYTVLSCLSIVYFLSYGILQAAYPEHAWIFSALNIIPGLWIGKITGTAAACKDFCND